MDYVKEHEEKLIKLYRRFAPEVREKILEIMELQAKPLKRNKMNGASKKNLRTGQRIIQNLEAYLLGNYIVLNRGNLDEYFAGK